MLVPPSLKATVPVGVPEPEATVELSVTLPLNTDGLGTPEMVVVVTIVFTTCEPGLDVLAVKFVIGWSRRR